MLLAGMVRAPVVAAETTVLGGTTDVDLVDVEIEQHWTISDLRPSTDAIPYRPRGTLWEAAARAELPHGGVPMITGFTAQGSTASYPVLWGVAAPLSVSPAALPPGGSVAGKLYFDVTADAPGRVAYTVDGIDMAVWE